MKGDEMVQDKDRLIEDLYKTIDELKSVNRRFYTSKLFDYAGQAMQGILSYYGLVPEMNDIAKWSVKQAKALLAALEDTE
jgi:hypothetical protein